MSGACCWRAAAVLAAAAGAAVSRSTKSVRRGLDLQEGTQTVLGAREAEGKAVAGGAASPARKELRREVDAHDVTQEPSRPMIALGIPIGWARRWWTLTALVVTASFLVLSWRIGFWLGVVGVAAGALTVVVAERLRQGALAHRVATWALRAPDGCSEPVELERIIASDVASLALARIDVLEAAARRAERSIDDAWLRALALERFQTAQQLVVAGEVGASRVPTDLTIRRLVVLGTAAVTVCTAVAVMTGNPLLMVLLTGATAVVAVGVHERRRRASLPRLMIAEATVPPVEGVFFIPEPAVVEGLVSLADGRPEVLVLATRVVGRAPDAEALRAERRLAQAETRCGWNPASAVQTIATLVTLMAVAVMIAEVLT